MSTITDPSNALRSFQSELDRSGVDLQRCMHYPSMFMHVDQPNGEPRFTYGCIDEGVVTAFVMFAAVGPHEGIPCFQTGYAVPDALRCQGRATAILENAIIEMRQGFGRAGFGGFWIEAVVGADNPASQRVAEKVLTRTPEQITDGISGLPALHYMRMVE